MVHIAILCCTHIQVASNNYKICIYTSCSCMCVCVGGGFNGHIKANMLYTLLLSMSIGGEGGYIIIIIISIIISCRMKLWLARYAERQYECMSAHTHTHTYTCMYKHIKRDAAS